MSPTVDVIGVIGGSTATDEDLRRAEAVGRALAEAGAALICGGRGGVMEAACRGAKAAGGLTIGVLPGANRDQANPYVDVAIVTGLGEARNAVIARSAQAVIAIGGSYGTLSEIAFALRLDTPVVGLGTWQIRREGHPRAPIIYVDAPQEAVARALALAKRV
jgi:uncharacterized protein (TIGR00725 family)